MSPMAEALGKIDALTRTMREVGHPVRAKILVAMQHEEQNREEGSRRKVGGVNPEGYREADPDEALGAISYHFRTLKKKKLIQLRREERVRGAVAHYYELTPAGRRLAQ